jgi:hypothetical protein
MILAIRLALGRLNRSFPAFDLALRRYWDVNHPSDPLEGYLRRNGALRRLLEAASVPDQIQSVVDDVVARLELPGVVGSLATTAARGIIGALREKRTEVRALARCGLLADLLEADQDIETFSYFAYLLAWEIHQLPSSHSVTPVILMDTFEEVSDRTHRDLERLVQRVVWLMPNALFVATGRNRLQKASLTGPDLRTGRCSHRGRTQSRISTSLATCRRTTARIICVPGWSALAVP